MLTWELLGAAVGAGLASGREIASFFGRYGLWGYAGAGLACMTAVWLADAPVARIWQGRWPERLWRGLVTLLLIATGGGMLSGAGETAVLVLPQTGVRWIAMLITLVLAWWLSQRTAAGLAWVSRAMLAVLALLILSGLALPPMRAVPVENASIPEGFLRALAYGGFNAALMSPVWGCSPAARHGCKKSLVAACMLLALLLMLGNAVLLRHPALMAEPLPFVRMSGAWGLPGRLLAAVSLYLAILSTLIACVKGTGGRGAALAGMGLAAMLGFSGVVEVLYPVLGGGCLALLAAAKFTNYNRNAFHSRGDML